MAARRPNKGAAQRPVRKPTVAGRKRPVGQERTDEAEASTPVETEAVETPAQADVVETVAAETDGVETGATETDAAETEAAETVATEAVAVTADEADANPADGASEELASSAPKASLVKPDVEDDFVPVDAADLVTADALDDESDSATSESDDSDSGKPAGKAARRPVSRVSTIKAGAGTASTTPAAPADDKRGLKSVGSGVRKATSSVSSLSFLDWRTTKIVAAVAVGLAILAAILAWTPGAKIGDNKAFVDTAATTDVLAQGRSKVCAPFAYEVNGYDKWVQNARVALTGQALDEFNKNIEAQKQIVQQSNSSVDCRLDTVGVQTLNGDHAVLIANLVLSRNVNGSILDSQTARVQANMVRKGDSWLMERLYTL